MKAGLDANCFKLIIDEIVDEKHGDALKSIDKIFANGHVPVDVSNFIIQEWKDCTGAISREFVEEWISAKILDDKIRAYPDSSCPKCRGELRRLGVPSKDAKILSFMKSFSAEYFVSIDIDCYEPKRKGCKSAERIKIISNRNGPVCRHMEKEYGVKIMDFPSILEE